MGMKRISSFAASLLAALLPLLMAHAGEVRTNGYDPLAVDPAFRPAHVDLTVHDAVRQRDIPIRVYLPRHTALAPVVLFSHGLGGTRAGSAFLGEHWAARGYVAVFLQHPGSDASVGKNEFLKQQRLALSQAASAENFLLRVKDVPAVLNQLEIWNTNKSHPLAGQLDLKKVGMSGHSFGAMTTEAVSGENLPVGGQINTDSRIQAAIAFSPSSPRDGNAAKAFGGVKIPWLLMTGTRDVAPIGHADMKSRLAVYPALHGAPKYEVVLFNAEHSAFTDRALPGDRARNPNHHRVILALSTAFWDAYLRGDAGALAWLNGAGPRSVMEPDDRWQFSSR
jgi:predicted dienelactone hydrolase